MRYFELNAKPFSEGFRPAHALRQMNKTGQSKRYTRSHRDSFATDFSSMQDIGHTLFRGPPGPSSREELVISPSLFRWNLSRIDDHFDRVTWPQSPLAQIAVGLNVSQFELQKLAIGQKQIAAVFW